MSLDEVNADETMESSEEEDEVALEARLKVVNEALSSNPYDYQSHVEKISLLSSLGELEELRSARTAFSKLYPLSVELWLTWLQDEQRLASSPKERKEVSHLFKKAVLDYLSVDIWIEYCSFILGDVGSGSEGVNSAREVFEEAVSAVGLHVEKGHLIWGAYRDFEVAVMNLHSRGYEHVFNVFKRQLAIPLLNMEKTLEELKDFEDIPGFKRLSSSCPLEPLYQTSLKKLKEREVFENELLQSKEDSEAHFAKYSEYISAMKNSKASTPPEVQNLYERRITDHCLNPLSWTEYLDYLDSELKIQSISIPVYKRAIRNCPWHGDLWCRYIRALERSGSEHKEITAIFEESLASGFSTPGDYGSLWMEYIGYFRRRMDINEEKEEVPGKSKQDLKELFERSLAHLESIPNSDPEMRLHRLWASVAGDRLRDMETARKVWATVVHGIGEQMIYWTEYVTLEKLFGDSKHLRRVFLRGMEKIKDFPEYFAQLWRQFELEEGDLSQFENAEEKIRRCLIVNRERMAKEGLLVDELKLKQSQKAERKKDKDKEKRRDKRRFVFQEKQTILRKRKTDENSPEEESPKKLKKDDDSVFKAPLPSIRDAKEQKDPEEAAKKTTSGVKPPPGYKGSLSSAKPIAPPPGFASRSKTSEPLASEPSTTPRVDGQDKTIFVSNLNFEVTEEELKEMMETTGSVKEVRLAKSFNGKSRGFAYVDFEDSQCVDQALLRDNEILRGRPVYISECNPNKEGHTFKYATTLEKNKLFVRGLNPETSKVDIHELFSEHGKVNEVRIVTFRNGKSKGIAYVDFQNEADASNALIKIDGSNFQGRSINVAFSNPPEKKKEAVSISSCLGGGVARKQVPFLPRSILSSTHVGKEGAQASNGEASGGEPPKSNADFRNLLLKK